MTCVGPLTELRPVAKCAGRPSLTRSGHAEVERNFFIVIALPRLRSRQRFGMNPLVDEVFLKELLDLGNQGHPVLFQHQRVGPFPDNDKPLLRRTGENGNKVCAI